MDGLTFAITAANAGCRLQTIALKRETSLGGKSHGNRPTSHSLPVRGPSLGFCSKRSPSLDSHWVTVSVSSLKSSFTFQVVHCTGAPLKTVMRNPAFIDDFTLTRTYSILTACRHPPEQCNRMLDLPLHDGRDSIEHLTDRDVIRFVWLHCTGTLGVNACSRDPD